MADYANELTECNKIKHPRGVVNVSRDGIQAAEVGDSDEQTKGKREDGYKSCMAKLKERGMCKAGK